MSELTFESVNKEIESLNLGELEVGLTREAKDVNSKICLIWKSIGGIIKLIAKFPFIPKKWRAALNLFISTMDSVCG